MMNGAGITRRLRIREIMRSIRNSHFTIALLFVVSYTSLIAIPDIVEYFVRDNEILDDVFGFLTQISLIVDAFLYMLMDVEIRKVIRRRRKIQKIRRDVTIINTVNGRLQRIWSSRWCENGSNIQNSSKSSIFASMSGTLSAVHSSSPVIFPPHKNDAVGLKFWTYNSNIGYFISLIHIKTGVWVIFIKSIVLWTSCFQFDNLEPRDWISK